MRGPVRLALAALLCVACARVVRQERREQPVDTGALVSFSAEADRRWDFGDGTPTLTGAQVRHAFSKAGRYEVKAFAGEAQTDAISVVVQPRSPFRAIPNAAQLAVVARTLDDVAPAIDFAERLGATAGLTAALERTPMLQFLLAPGQASSSFDRLEGAGLFVLEDGAAVSCVGVIDEAAAAKAFSEYLVDHGFTPGELGTFERAGAVGRVFTDRGTLYFAMAAEGRSVEAARHHVIEGPAAGLEGDPRVAEALADTASGGLVVVVKASALRDTLAPVPWAVAAAAVDVRGDRLQLTAKLVAARPLWSTPTTVAPQRLLRAVPSGAIATFSADVPAKEVFDALGLDGKRGQAPRERPLLSALTDDDDDVRAGLSVLSRRVEAALYFDVDEFLAATIRGGGRPSPKVTLLGEIDAPDRALMKGAIDRVFARRRAPSVDAETGGVKTWNTLVLGHALELALGPKVLSARWGRGVDGAPIDALAPLERRADGAGGPGHVTLLVDLGQLVRELLEPRQVPGLDPRKVVATQALASTFLSQLTSLDQLFVDLAPTPTGARLFLEVSLSKRSAQE